jgi:exopolyphosphatase / guanosine-5'-triphosphate,3'-diphosphate pyrophosphatase
MLIARWIEEKCILKPLLRMRSYIRLARDFEAAEARTIKEPAVERAIRCLKEFGRISEAFDPAYIQAVATGVVREAANRDDVIRVCRQETNLPVRILSGEEEARLTGLGVSRSVDVGNRPFVIFDLGGGSTEFLLAGLQSPMALSVPLGAALLTERYLVSDPPLEEDVGRAKARVIKLLEQRVAGDFRCEPFLLIGTGGTVTTLAAMVHGIGADEIEPERMNGLILEKNRVEELFSKMSRMPLGERLQMPCLDQGRAEVILGGTLAVIEILKYFDVPETMISLSDLLEGVLFDELGYSLPGDNA